MAAAKDREPGQEADGIGGKPGLNIQAEEINDLADDGP